MPHQLRAATPADKLSLVALLDRVFVERPFPESFAVRFPHLFTDTTIGQHRIACAAGDVIACVGGYTFQAILHGQPLTVAGIGQVATDPRAQGRGMMTQLLADALAAAPEVDLWWLYGDRRRYARCGFAPGGTCIVGTTWERYCADVVREGPPIRALDAGADGALIARSLDRSPFHLQLDAVALQRLLTGTQVRGWTDGDATVVLDRSARTVWALHGTVERVARLIAHQVDRHQQATPQNTGMRIEAAPTDRIALQLLRQLSGSISTQATASLRIGRLAPLLRCAAAASPPPPGARLCPTVLDGGSAGRIRIGVEQDRWNIHETTETPDLVLAGADLAELITGTVPPAAWPLPADTALRLLLPIPIMIPGIYAL